MAGLETYDGASKKPFKAHGLLNKSQLKLASYIKANKDVTLQGTKRFTDKSGEYYLKNINLQNRKQFPNSTKKNSLNNPQNLENILNGNIGRIKRRASKIVTLLPENSLTPIPKKEGINKTGIANGYGKKELNDAQRTAVFIRRLEYSTSMKKQMDEGKNMKNHVRKIQLIQEWWKTMFKIIKLQKNMRGFLFRKKLMNNLEHQEKLLQFITEFDNIHNYHLYRQFMDNLKKKRDYEKAKLMEKCEDFNDKLDNLERLHNMKNFKKCFEKWKEAAKQKRQEDLERLCKTINDVYKRAAIRRNKETFKTIRDKTKNEEDKLNDKAKDFMEKKARKNLFDGLNKPIKFKKKLKKVKDKVDYRNKKDFLDRLKKIGDIAKFVDKVDDVIKKHNDKVNDEAKKDFLDKLKDIRDKGKLRDALKKWKDVCDDMKNANKIVNKLKKYRQNELKKKAEEEKKKFAISSGVNDFELIPEKKEEPIQISAQNDLNIEAKPKPVFELAVQNFSLIAPDKFEFGEPMEKNKKIDNSQIDDQFSDLMKKNLAKKMNDILSKAEKESDDRIKKDILDKLRKMNAIARAVKILDHLVNEKPKKDTLDRLKKNTGFNEAFKVLDRFFNKNDDRDKKDVLDKLKKNADNQKALEDLNKILEKKLKQKFMDNLKKNNDDKKGLEKLNKVIGDNLKKEFMDKLKKLTNISKAADALENFINNKLKKDAFDNLKKNNKICLNTDKLEKLLTDKLKRKFLDRLENAEKPKYKSKRISRRTNSKRKRSKSKRNKERKMLRQAFDLWREKSSFGPTRNVLERIKRNRLMNLDNLDEKQKNDLLQKYKNKMMQVLLNIYKRQRNLLRKKYLDKWRKAKNPENDSEMDEPKYKKKPRIEDKREFTDSDTNSFNPTYYNPKHNIYNQRSVPYRKRYAKRPYEQPEDFLEETPNRDDKINIKQIDKDDYSDTSSNNESNLGNGEYLIQNKKIISQPRNYTSQSFFIDKNNGNNVATSNYQLNTHNTNQLPMTMKGDFVSLIEQNPKILAQKNPRIQVTNATCDLNQIINNENTDEELNSEEVNYEMDKLNNNFVIDKNKVLSKVIKNCDKDLYASQRPFRAKKDQWYSVSIPLNDNEAKWEFLNNIKGERDKNNLNKFELIQKENEPIKEENEEKEEAPYSRKTFRSEKKSDKKNPNNKENTTYKLREMNYSQFYRSPMRTPSKVEEEEKSLIANRIRRPGDRQNTQKSFMNTSLNTSRYNSKLGRNYNIDRSRGKIEFDPKYRSIDYDNGYEFEDSDD
jgi:hypothetical protein